MGWALAIGLLLSGALGWWLFVRERGRRARLSEAEREAEDAEMAVW